MEPRHYQHQGGNDPTTPAPHSTVATPTTPTAPTSLEQSILRFLQQQKAPKAAAQIVRHIGPSCQKRAVNAILYRLLREGKVQNSTPHGSKPMWTAADRWGGPRGQGGPGVYADFAAGQFQGQGRSWQQRGYPFQARSWSGPVHPYQQGLMPDYSGAPFRPGLLPSPGLPGRGGGTGGGTGGGGNRGGGTGGGGNRGRGGGEYRGGGRRWAGRGRGRGGEWDHRGRGGSRGSAPNRPGCPPSQKPTHRQHACSHQKRMKFDKKFQGDTPKGGSITECDDGRSTRTVPQSSAANKNTVPCSSVNQASASVDQMPALSSALRGAGAETARPPGVLNVNAASACTTDTTGACSLLPPKHQRHVSDDMSDSDCEMGDCEGPNLTTRFRDMMGTLTFDEEVFDPDEEMLEEDDFLGWCGDVMGESSSLAPDQTVVTTEQAGALKERDGDRGCDLTESRVEDISRAVCPLTGSDRTGENLPACSSLSVEGIKALTPSQGPHQQSAAPSAFNCPPPMPPREWIDSQPAFFSSSPSPVQTHTAATVSSGAIKAGSPSPVQTHTAATVSSGAIKAGSPSPVQTHTAATVSSGAMGVGRGCNPSTALLPLLQVRGGGRGLRPLLLAPSLPRPPGGGRVTIRGSLDVREVESSFFSMPPPPPPPPPPPITPASAATKPAGAQTSPPPNSSSSSQTVEGFRSLDEFEWQPLTERQSQDTPPCSSSSSSSPLQRYVIGEGGEERATRLVMSCPCPPGSDASLSSSPPSPHHQAVPAASLTITQPVSADQPASMSHQVAEVDFAGTSLSPSALHPSLQKFAAEGLTLYVPLSGASVLGSAEKTSANGGTSRLPFQKPLTPLELIEQERGQTSMAAGPCQDVPINNNALPFSSPASITFPQCPSRPLSASCGPVSLPAPEGREGEGRGATLQISAESFAALNKNPISALMEHAQSRHMTATIDVVSQRGPSHRPVFVMSARVGNREFQRIRCHNKKDGKKEAADVALRTLIAEGQLSTLTPSPSASIAPEDMTHFDRMAALTHQTFNSLIASIPENLAGRKVIAGLVMKRGEEDQGLVISLGSGNRCITGDKLSLEGNTVNDSHAEIITRRGFLRFLYQQLLHYEAGRPHDLFEPGDSGKLKVKKGVTFHLYISTAPCGDGALFSPRDAESNSGMVPDVNRREHRPTFSSTVQGLLRTKMEGGEGTIPVETKDRTIQTWDGIVRGERLRTMSCTDKICRWNVLGLQGALLSHFLEPIYLDSLTLGFLYDHGHLSRAVCCRLARGQPSLDQALAPGYRLNHPWLGRVTACQPLRETQKTKAFSINWAIGDPAPEILDGTVGHCYTVVEKKLFSRVSKRSLYDSFQRVAAHLGRSDLCGAASYRQAKMAAEGFQASKAAMFGHFQQRGCGWVQKPAEEEMFS